MDGVGDVASKLVANRLPDAILVCMAKRTYGTRYQLVLDTCQLPIAHDPGWEHGLDSGGYGVVWVPRFHDYMSVHKLVCIETYGFQPTPHHMALHSCRSRHCYWVEHLAWGIATKNNGEDKLRDGTSNRGSRHGRAQLSEDQVLELCRLRDVDGASTRDLAVIFSIRPATVRQILAGSSWSWLTGRGRGVAKLRRGAMI